MKIVMPYIGGCLSKNGSRITGRGGVRTNCYKPEVKMWMWQLEKKVKDNKKREFDLGELTNSASDILTVETDSDHVSAVAAVAVAAAATADSGSGTI